MKNQKEGPNLAAAAARLGSIKTPKKAAASARNVAATRFTKKPLSEIDCTCGLCPETDSISGSGGHHTCPRARAIYMRRYRERKTAR